MPVGAPPAAVDVAALYRRFSARLEAIVRRAVGGPDEVVEDACQFAWVGLIHHRHRVLPNTALGWLVTTAVREARRLLRLERRDLSLDAILEQRGEATLGALGEGPEQVVHRRQRIARVCELPERQQRLLWLHAAGHSYIEIAAREGDTRRTVERQLLRAKRRMRAIAE